jgi:hypothetical protein
MLRTELIPQTSAAINKGKVFYHFSMQHTATNAPSPKGEHQINFFESHFTEMKYGQEGGSDNHLHWYVGGKSQWDAELVAGDWHNVAYGIDFSAGTVEFYHSTGADALEKIAGPVSASTDSNGADWHLGVLRLTNDGSQEDWNFSGVYIESGDLTTSIVSPGGSGSAPASSPSKASSSAAASSTKPAASSTSAAASSSTKAASTTPAAASSSTKAATSSSVLSSSAAPESSCVVEYVYV